MLFKFQNRSKQEPKDPQIECIYKNDVKLCDGMSERISENQSKLLKL